jgi:uncharacterized protein YndB with AHSA1/START domain
LVVKEEAMRVTREVDIEGTPQEVWDALVSEEGRERWLGEERHDIDIEVQDPPHRLVWWWAAEDADEDLPAAQRRVEIEVRAVPAGTRVIVVESTPSFPLPALAASFAMVAA